MLFWLINYKTLPQKPFRQHPSQLCLSFIAVKSHLEFTQAILILFLNPLRKQIQFFLYQIVRKPYESILWIHFLKVQSSSYRKINQITIVHFRLYRFPQSYAIQPQLQPLFPVHLLIISVLNYWIFTFRVNGSSAIIVEQVKGFFNFQNLLYSDELISKRSWIKAG